VHVSDSAVRLSDIEAIWGSRKVSITEARSGLREKGRPLFARARDGGEDGLPRSHPRPRVHPQAIVGWSLRRSHPRVQGTLEPLDLSGQLTAQTEDFAVFDRSVRRPERSG
jgi:hypothetical protein